MNTLIIKTTDIYEIVYYLTHKSTVVEGIEVLPSRGKQLICQFALSGSHLNSLQNDYIARTASINISEFRRLIQQVNGMIDKARKEAKKKAAQEAKQ